MGALAVAPPIIGAVIGAVDAWQNPGKQPFFWPLVIGALWLVLVSFLNVRQAYSQEKEREMTLEYDGLNGALHTLYSTVCVLKTVGSSSPVTKPQLPSGRLRVTIHRVVPSSEEENSAEALEQLLPYIGGDGGAPGRHFSIHTGIVGRAVRERASFCASRQNDDYEGYIEELVQYWGYTPAQARDLRHDRTSWFAVPILGKSGSDGETTIAVVYLDSDEQGFFTEPIQQVIIGGCAGITEYVDKTYS